MKPAMTISHAGRRPTACRPTSVPQTNIAIPVRRSATSGEVEKRDQFLHVTATAKDAAATADATRRSPGRTPDSSLRSRGVTVTATHAVAHEDEQRAQGASPTRCKPFFTKSAHTSGVLSLPPAAYPHVIVSPSRSKVNSHL